MNTMATANMANMNPTMGGPVGAPMPMMNNGALAPQVGGPRQAQPDSSRTLLNTYIYEYFMRYGQYDCARAILQADPNIKIKDGTGNGDGGLGGDLGDSMDTDTKDGMDTKRPADLPAPNVPTPVPDSCFLYEWFCLFWDMFNSQKGKGQSQQVNQYVQHTQQQSRMRQEQQQNMLRSLRPEFAHQAAQQQYQAQMMRGMQNGAMGMNMKQANLQRAAMANSQNPNLHMLQQQQKAAAQMQRDPSDMDGNRARPASPSGGAENAPSPSKRQRLENGPFNPNPGAMMPNGRQPQGMPGQPQHHGTQMAQKPMANPGGPQTQGSPMNQQGPDGAALNQYYNPSDMASGNMRQGGPGNAQGQSNGALQDYQMQLMLLEQQNKKRLMMARQEQDMSGGMREGPAPGPPGGPAPPGGPNAQNFQGTSPPGGRAGASPNPSEQMKRANQMNNAANMGSPLPDGAQNRSSPGAINFIGNNLDPNGAPNFFKAGSDGGMNMMNAAQMNVNGMRHPNSHPGPPFNGPMTPQQQIMAARQAQAQQQAHAQGGQGMQWSQNGPNGQMAGQGPQPQVQGTPNQRSMPPPQAPAAPANSTNSRNATSSPQTSTAAPPTPQAANKPAPKKKESKSAKSKAATQKKTNTNLNTGATPAADSEPQQETPAPATPITPVNAGNFAKNQTLPAQVVPNGQPPAPAQAPQGAPVPAQQHPDPTQTNNFMDPSMDFQMDFANPLTSGDVLNDFDFDSFLHESNGEDGPFDFNAGTFMEGNEIGAD